MESFRASCPLMTFWKHPHPCGPTTKKKPLLGLFSSLSPRFSFCIKLVCNGFLWLVIENLLAQQQLGPLLDLQVAESIVWNWLTCTRKRSKEDSLKWLISCLLWFGTKLGVHQSGRFGIQLEKQQSAGIVGCLLQIWTAFYAMGYILRKAGTSDDKQKHLTHLTTSVWNRHVRYIWLTQGALARPVQANARTWQNGKRTCGWAGYGGPRVISISLAPPLPFSLTSK